MATGKITYRGDWTEPEMKKAHAALHKAGSTTGWVDGVRFAMGYDDMYHESRLGRTFERNTRDHPTEFDLVLEKEYQDDGELVVFVRVDCHAGEKYKDRGVCRLRVDL